MTTSWSRRLLHLPMLLHARRRSRPSTSSCTCADPEALLAGVRNAGSVFIGGSAVVGDYAAGATHVLPTGGLARSSGGLGLEMFMKPLQIVRATAAGAAAAARVVGPIARAEGLPLHAAAAERVAGAVVSGTAQMPVRDGGRSAPAEARDAVPLPDALRARTPGRRPWPRSPRGTASTPCRC